MYSSGGLKRSDTPVTGESCLRTYYDQYDVQFIQITAHALHVMLSLSFPFLSEAYPTPTSLMLLLTAPGNAAVEIRHCVRCNYRTH